MPSLLQGRAGGPGPHAGGFLADARFATGRMDGRRHAGRLSRGGRRAWRPRPRCIAAGPAAERVWLLEHPPLYTAGTSARDGDLVVAALSGASHRPRRPIYLSRARPAGDLRHARPAPSPAGRAGLCGGAGSLGDREPGPVQHPGGAPGGSGRRLGRAARQGRQVSTARPPRTRSPRSGCGCAAGSAITAWRSTWTRTCVIIGDRALRRSGRASSA